MIDHLSIQTRGKTNSKQLAGIGYNRGETIPCLIGTAAPATGQSGDTVFAINIIDPTSRLESEGNSKETQ